MLSKKIAGVTMAAVAMAGVLGTGAASANATRTITWLVRTDPVMNPWERATIKAFEAVHPNIKVQMILSPSGAPFDQKLLTMVAAGDPPDIFSHWGNDSWADFVYRGIAQNLTPYIQKTHFSFAGMDPALLKQYSIGNKVYGIPFATGGSYLFYNMSLLKKAHIPIPTTNWNDRSWNWPTVLKDARKMTVHSAKLASMQWGFNDELWPENANFWLFGGDIFPASAYRTGVVQKVSATSPAVEQAVQWQRNLIYTYKVAPTPAQTTGLSTTEDPFLSGKIGMEMTGIWGFWVFKPAKFQWGAAPLPYVKTDRNVLFTDPWMMAKGAAHPNAAWTFLQWLANPKEGDRTYVLTSGVFPVWKQLVPVWAQNEHKLHPWMSVASLIQLGNGSMQHGSESANHLLINYGQMDSVMGNVLQPVWTGKTAPKAALAELQTQLTQTIKEAGITKGR